MWKYIQLFICVILFVSCKPSLKDIVDETEKATFIIYAYDEYGSPQGTGSGFFIDSEGIGITNYHVLDGAVKAVLKTSDEQEYEINQVLASDRKWDIIKFSVKNTTSADATNYRFVLTAAKLTNIYSGGVYDVNADAWTPGATMREYTLENLTINSNAVQYHSKEVLLIPGEQKVGVYVKANIEASDDNGTTWKVVSEVEKTFTNVVAPEKATAYSFIVELGVGEEIKFTAATMPEWADGDGNDDTVLQ